METVKCLVFTYTLTLFGTKKFFCPEGMGGGGGVDNTRGNSGGVDGLFLWSKNGNSLEEGGLT